jgi:hypothetical protein
MAITVTAAITSPGSTRAGQRISGILTIVNNGANTISVRSLQLSEASTLGAVFGQPSFLTPNVALESSYPNITTSSTAYYPFSIVVASPNTPGAPAQAPNAMHDDVCPPGNSWCRINVDVRTYDSTATEFVMGSTTLNFPVVSAAQALISQGGAEQWNAAMNAVNWFFL